jgi:hypothetical protein
MKVLNMNYADSDGQREVCSAKKVKKLLNSLDEPDVHRPQVVLENQAHLYNYKCHKIQYEQGLRSLILRRNQFSSGFAEHITKTLFSDKYLKKLDLSANKLNQHALSMIVKKGMIDNPSLICLDARLNPGFTEKM